jgi:hypothetical protein
MIHAHVVSIKDLERTTVSSDDIADVKAAAQAAINRYKDILPKDMINQAQAITDSIRGGADGYAALLLPTRVNNVLTAAVAQIEQGTKLTKDKADATEAQAKAGVAPQLAQAGLQEAQLRQRLCAAARSVAENQHGVHANPERSEDESSGKSHRTFGRGRYFV